MKFSITYQRAFMGNDIEIQINAEADEVISAVDYNLDGIGLPADDLSETPVVSFHRSFSRVGETQKAGCGFAPSVLRADRLKTCRVAKTR
jgi:hypothetical protein